jgi:hypothetical protein
MAVNMAQKRARKAQRQKQLVALKRRADALEASPSARVGRAAQAPIRGCYLTDEIFSIGIGTLVLARGGYQGHVTFASFLIDVFCLGIKDVMFAQAEDHQFEEYMDMSNASSPMIAVDPSYARKLLRELAAWAQSIGFAPHRDFAAMERMFGDVSADASDAVFQFGQEGRPAYIPGPSESASQIRMRTALLDRYVGGAQLKS